MVGHDVGGKGQTGWRPLNKRKTPLDWVRNTLRFMRVVFVRKLPSKNERGQRRERRFLLRAWIEKT
jgi:hypothetical protein